ncbi:hypothetical protein G7Y89_g3168 [Cudoniella acicularis]|uniref:Uncharacterized protein n=1 Tax=Cudoniella acicularis TaxID=354080 RepID=A0A8H4W687_9HELO|nr:hypothetical protein G7Y89_g3168 [Cudoniella acicularis]
MGNATSPVIPSGAASAPAQKPSPSVAKIARQALAQTQALARVRLMAQAKETTGTPPREDVLTEAESPAPEASHDGNSDSNSEASSYSYISSNLNSASDTIISDQATPRPLNTNQIPAPNPNEPHWDPAIRTIHNLAPLHRDPPQKHH